MTDIDAPQAADPVDQFGPVAVVDISTLGPRDHGARALLFQRIQIGKGLNQVIVLCKNVERIFGHDQSLVFRCNFSDMPRLSEFQIAKTYHLF